MIASSTASALPIKSAGRFNPTRNLQHPSINPNTNHFNDYQGYLYDKTGNITQDPTALQGTRHFTFNGDNKQTEVKNAQGQLIGQYFYDGEGKRIKKKVYSGALVTEETIFVYASGKLIAEYSTAPAPMQPTTSYTMTDQLGSPRVKHVL